MSGIEAAGLALGMISAIISIIDATNQVYEAIKDEAGLPTNFKKSAIKLPLISKLLDDAERFVEAADELTKTAFIPTLEDCKVQATQLQALFEKVMPEEGESRWDRYVKAARTIGKGGRVENLVGGILGDLQLLVMRFPEVTTPRTKVQLGKAVEEVTKMEPSLPDGFEQMPSYAHYGSGAQNINTGSGIQHNNSGTGNQNSGSGQQYIGTNHIVKNEPNLSYHNNASHERSIVGQYVIVHNYAMEAALRQDDQLIRQDRQDLASRSDTTSSRLIPSKDEALTKLLSENGYDINNKETYFQALDWAEQNSQVAIVRLLLEQGSDITGKDKKGNTMLAYASSQGFEDIVGILLVQGAEIEAKDNQGRTALLRGLQHTAAVQILLERGADTESGAVSGFDTPLIMASMYGLEAVVRLLLERGSKIEARGSVGLTPLQRASMAGHIDIVRLLLDRGANVNEKNNTGNTALGGASYNGHAAVVRLLLERGADIRAKDSAKKTALDRAKEKDHAEVVRILRASRTGLFRSW